MCFLERVENFVGIQSSSQSLAGHSSTRSTETHYLSRALRIETFIDRWIMVMRD